MTDSLTPPGTGRPDRLTTEQRIAVMRQVLKARERLAGGDEEARAGGEAPPLRPVPRDGRPLPLSFAQQRLWFVDRLRPGSSAYVLPLPLRLRGPLHLPSLHRALSALAARHESLRTRFGLRDGEPEQRIDPPAPVPLPVVDLRAHPPEAREAELERLMADEGRRPFDLERDAPFRCTAVRLADDDTALLLVLHHIVGDGWSMEPLVRDVSAFYEAFAAGTEPRLPPLPVQYADFAAWQRAWLRGPVLDALAGWWRTRLAGAPALLEVPTDRPRLPDPDDDGDRVGIHVGTRTAAALRELSRTERVTLFMTLLAAWQLLLARYSGQDDVVVGTPIAGRTRVEVEGLIGFFVNTLALRGDLSGDPGFRALLRRVREATLGAFQHQDLPFERLVEELGVERARTHTPVFQAMFMLQNATVGEPSLGGLAVEGLHGGASGAVKFDLSLTMEEAGEALHGVLSFRRALWDRATMERLLTHYGRVLEAVAADPDLSVSAVPLLAEGERERLLARDARPALPVSPCGVHELFEAQALRTPDAVALVLDGETMTYGALDRAANRLARHLRGQGVRAETRVAVCLDRSFDLVVAVLAVFKAGGTMVPLDPTHPPARLAYQADDADAALLLTTEALRAAAGAPRARPVRVDADAGAIAAESDAPLPISVHPDQLAWVTYTSGSTGRPKGAMVPHRGAVSYLAALARDGSLGPDDVVLQRTTLSFDASIRDLLGPLTAGARVVILRANEAADPAVLLRRIREDGVTAVLAIVPSVLRPLLDAAEDGVPGDSLRLLLCSGEPLATADCRRARRLFGPGLRVGNLWGATECTMSSTVHVATEGDGEGIAPVGLPIANTRVHVLDGRMQPAPAGVAGEAYIGGIGVGRGYHGRPGLTAERFLPDPFGPPGARLYRVGDRVRRREGGPLEFLGRVDQQFKVNGVRVEAGEVEAALRAVPGVREAVAAPHAPAGGEARLVAWVTGEVPADDALRAALERTLPAHMVPGVFVRMEALPRLPNGKVDRGTLPAPAAGGRAEGTAYAPPTTATERVLVEVWESLLEARPIGVDDSFFRLGGHSMLAVRMMTQVRRRLGVELPLAALFEHPTVRGLAERVDGGAGSRAWSPLVAIQPDGGRVPLFFVHPVGGEVLCYADLARALGPDQPFYGLQAGDLTRLGETEASIEEMAARYVEAIRRVRPRGPYLLGGWSFGGFVAFEMARQLAAQGEAVPLVTMIDTRGPGERRPADDDPCARLAGMARAEAQRAGREVAVTEEELRRLDPDARIGHVLGLLQAEGVVPPDTDAGWLGAFLRGMEVRMRSALAYTPAPSGSRIALFVPGDRVADAAFAALPANGPGWEAYASGPLLTHTVPGDHTSMIRGENAAVLAGHLRAILDALPV
ncbi:amino acid adenylation domain-containing protein [Longimicrobium sp.]|uniref:amino acid adenylation domain-containing protein n=1 Tax=Longimicrobium sp. TaxID=2029185 RepID=UPI002E30F8E6|nr:amino acid adenylation domain-containing protein [Longimicrobium sp.]HEX6039914.1 amino acid adenylation domain-containing protein [Longimicrobium sp.]